MSSIIAAEETWQATARTWNPKTETLDREQLEKLQLAKLRYQCEWAAARSPSPPCDLTWADSISGADGASSTVRAARAADFVPSLERRFCKYMWLGTDVVFDAFKFFIHETPHGVFQAHGYPYSDRMSTFIVEAHEAVWRRAGLDRRLTDGHVLGRR